MIIVVLPNTCRSYETKSFIERYYSLKRVTRAGPCGKQSSRWLVRQLSLEREREGAERDTHSQRDRETERGRDRERQTQTDRQIETDREANRERERETRWMTIYLNRLIDIIDEKIKNIKEGANNSRS